MADTLPPGTPPLKLASGAYSAVPLDKLSFLQPDVRAAIGISATSPILVTRDASTPAYIPVPRLGFITQTVINKLNAAGFVHGVYYDGGRRWDQWFKNGTPFGPTYYKPKDSEVDGWGLATLALITYATGAGFAAAASNTASAAAAATVTPAAESTAVGGGISAGASSGTIVAGTGTTGIVVSPAATAAFGAGVDAGLVNATLAGSVLAGGELSSSSLTTGLTSGASEVGGGIADAAAPSTASGPGISAGASSGTITPGSSAGYGSIATAPESGGIGTVASNTAAATGGANYIKDIGDILKSGQTTVKEAVGVVNTVKGAVGLVETVGAAINGQIPGDGKINTPNPPPTQVLDPVEIVGKRETDYTPLILLAVAAAVLHFI